MSDRAYLVPVESPARYPLGEEIANAITHGVWSLLSIAGLVVLIVSAATRGDAWHVVSFTIFGASAVVLFTMSTIYHAVAAPRAKKVLRVIDHSSIYLLIAGTYTPFALTALRPTIGWAVFGVIWGAAVLGIALKPFLTGKMKFMSTVAYVLMGWIIVFAWKPLAAATGERVLGYLVAGGVAYTVGAAFYLLKRRCWTHPVWHLFVGAGATLHFFAVLALLPQG